MSTTEPRQASDMRAFLLRRQVMNEIRELTEMEVEAVSGGSPLIELGNITTTIQNNFAVF